MSVRLQGITIDDEFDSLFEGKPVMRNGEKVGTVLCVYREGNKSVADILTKDDRIISYSVGYYYG